MSIEIQGYILNQRQLDVLTPILNDLVNGVITDAEYESACMKALEAAGCPLGYDKGLDKSASVEVRAQRWVIDGDVGKSSRAIWAHMTGASMARTAPPVDPDDINRCLLLLDLIPEWAPRMGEMAAHGGDWAIYAPIWPQLSATFLAEAGLNWSKGAMAAKTYGLMLDAKAQARAHHCPRCGGTGSLSTGITEAPTTQCHKCAGTGNSSTINKGLPKDE